MLKIVKSLRGVFLTAMFHSARITFSILKVPVRGTMVAVWNKGRLLIIQKSYLKVWSIPGGLVKKGETWEQAAVRETFEEVGVSINEKDLVYIAQVPGDLGANDRARFFEVVVNGSVDVKIDEWEIVSAEFVTPEDALRRPLYNHVERYLRARQSQESARLTPLE